MGNGYAGGARKSRHDDVFQLTSGPPLRVSEHVNRETLKPELSSVAIGRESAR